MEVECQLPTTDDDARERRIRPTLDHQNVQRWFELLGSIKSIKCRLYAEATRVDSDVSRHRSTSDHGDFRCRRWRANPQKAFFASVVGCIDNRSLVALG
jgi:hypothetical protein